MFLNEIILNVHVQFNSYTRETVDLHIASVTDAGWQGHRQILPLRISLFLVAWSRRCCCYCWCSATIYEVYILYSVVWIRKCLSWLSLSSKNSYSVKNANTFSLTHPHPFTRLFAYTFIYSHSLIPTHTAIPISS